MNENTPMDPIADRLVAVIMAGGGGTRFWPRSRARHPKQFLAFDGRRSLLQGTLDRLEGLVRKERTFVITGREHVDLVAAQTGLEQAQIIGEPCGRDTAPCIGVGTLVARRVQQDALVIVLAADHLIGPRDAFQASVRRAAELAAERPALVTMGLRPDRPATGYGYVEIGRRVDERMPAAYEVAGFREKPDLEEARRFVLSGRFLWNSGNLAFQADAMLDGLQRHLPKLHRQLMSLRDPGDSVELDRVYPQVEPVSIDYGVLEHEGDRLVVEATFDWDDLGTFEAVARHATRHGQDDLARGDAVFLGSKGCLVDNDLDGLVVVSGLDGVLVVRTEDVVLVMPREKAEEVKQIVQSLKDQGRDSWL